ncbi:MAG TPA: tyrosine-type recombinase/integrase [Steroidobacteraceae bacterium]|nr:tyrosine-type recombinase/integrase [Steroidobacteraceae bacterium]
MSVQRDPRGYGWICRWSEHGRQRSRSFKLKRDADAFDLELKRRRQMGPLAVQQLTTSGETLGEWIEQRWIPEHGVTLEASTLTRYASVYEVHIAPTLDSVPIREISVSRLRAWQAELIRAGVSAGTVDKARTYLSSVLRHAAESEAIPGNPLGLVRPPKHPHRDGVRPFSPALVELALSALRSPAPRDVASSEDGQRKRRGYSLPAPGTAFTNQRDALIAALIAYAGLRPGEIRGLRYEDIGENTLRIERAADEFGNLKPTKTGRTRSVRLLAPLAQDLNEFRMAAGRPPGRALLLEADKAPAWTKSNWNVWVKDRWHPACRAAGLDWIAKPYDLRHSFASLLLAEGRQPLWVARQLGHSVAVLMSTYAHLIEEFEDATKIDAEEEIRAARRSRAATRLLQEDGNAVVA